jgi:5-methylcytosine-specific restriction endonuclease McrA
MPQTIARQARKQRAALGLVHLQIVARELRKKAKAAGATRYFTGLPCSHGHIAERMTSNAWCVACLREMTARRYPTDPDYRERTKARMRKSYAGDPQKFKDRSRENYYANPQPWKDRTRRAVLADPIKERARQHLRKEQRKEVPGRFTAADLRAQLDFQNGRCLCGVIFVQDLKWTIDHIIPISRGGTHWPDNIQLLCLPCNLSKAAKTMDEWRP